MSRILLCILFLTIPNFSQVYDSTAVFKSLAIGLNVSRNINNDIIHEFWDVKTGFGISVSSEFYMGRIGIEFDQLSFKKKSAELPDFNSLFLSLLWKNEIPLYPVFSLFVTCNAGIFNMIFDQTTNEIPPGLLIEREIGFRIKGGFDFEIIEELKFSVSTYYTKVFTSQRINLVFINAGVIKTFNIPSWLGKILK